MRLFLPTVSTLLLSCIAQLSCAQAERWFQVELSIFSNESNTDRSEEVWTAERLQLEYPERLRRLKQIADLLMIDELLLDKSVIDEADPLAAELDEAAEAELLAEELTQQREAAILATGPNPPRQEGDFKLFDFDRDDYLKLAPSESDFQQTNRAIERSSDHRLLFHGLWRQAVVDEADATPIYIQGGLNYGDQNELQGSITIRFNENRDRVVIDANLWLTEFSIVEDLEQNWQLPAIPTEVEVDNEILSAEGSSLNYHPIKVYHMQQSRGMRSTEFHYMDHPAMGLLIMVEPYEVPPPVEFELPEQDPIAPN